MEMKSRTTLNIWLTISVFLLATVATAPGGVIYVDDDASLGGNGQTWGTAYKYLQDALNKPPTSGDQIWVAEGTYKPDQGGGVTSGDRNATFQLIDSVEIYGGFAGGETSRDQRDTVANVTILSGDLAGNDGPGEWENNDENSYRVVTGSGADSAARTGFGKIAGMDIIEDAYFVDVDILEVLSTDGGTVAGYIMNEGLSDLSSFFVP